MSSMLRASTIILLAYGACLSVPARCQDGREWDQARAQLMTSQRGSMGQAIERWKLLTSTDALSFSEYAGFLLTYPGFPEEEKLRASAERALGRDAPDSSQLIAYFRRFPPVTNPAKARYATALAALNQSEAGAAALLAWRGGEMSDAAEAALFSLFGGSFTLADHDARMDALLWQGSLAQAERQIARVSPGARDAFMHRLALAQGSPPGTLALPVTPELQRDPGYVYNRVRQARRVGNIPAVVALLANRPTATRLPFDPTRWVSEHLAAARSADAGSAVRIAAAIDDAFAPGTDISRMGFKLRDDYTSLMWLGATKALWSLGDAKRAAPLFYRYGAAAQTPQTRTKGFYWAGRALARAGDSAGAARYFEMAAAFPDHFYGILALERLGRPLPAFNNMPDAVPTPAERAQFNAQPIVAAVREVARGAEWRTTVRFFREIAEQAQTRADHVMVADLAREIGRRDLGVILGQQAHADGFGDFQKIAFPLIPTPPGSDWTMVHAITRQESQFAMNAISHAGARGLMQLMPGTAREQAGKMGLGYDMAALMTDASYNIRLGDGFYARMMDYYGGSYPLAVGAYNAGPGNVNKWLRANGDPRTGAVDWIDWLERIPISETRNYIQRVLENAVVYEAMNPDKARYKGPNPMSRFLGKRDPG
jgi:soluble lytic murein transglycosylase